MRMLAVELWLEVLKYTDTSTLNKIINIINEIEVGLGELVYTLVCKKIVNKNKNIRMMNELIMRPLVYRKKREYLMFKMEFLNEERIKGYSEYKMNEKSYRYYIYNNKEECFGGNDRNYKLFMNLTKIVCEENDNILTSIKYYDNDIPIYDIFRLTT